MQQHTLELALKYPIGIPIYINIIIAIYDISSSPAKVVKSMRLALRKQWSKTFVELPLQGCVAERLSQDAKSNIITKLISQE